MSTTCLFLSRPLSLYSARANGSHRRPLSSNTNALPPIFKWMHAAWLTIGLFGTRRGAVGGLGPDVTHVGGAEGAGRNYRGLQRHALWCG